MDRPSLVAPDDFYFLRPITITVHYSNSDVGGIPNEYSLRLYYFTNNEWLDAATTCNPPFSYLIDPVNNFLQIPICHLSRLGMGG
ncbi:MAG: hypothetical protein L0322_04005 [Chloroflexi bacterium]|nr:hypothetical protein [Chloroflexota bacterium]